jgi:pimeloyl-ACP methyl ester carboxylesterase
MDRTNTSSRTLRLAHEQKGSGQPLLFIHGFPHDRGLWSGQLAALSSDALCIAPDLRGFGESDASPPFSMEQYADDLADLLGEMRIPRAVVAGLSMGGYVAFALFKRHPHLISALILADTRAGADSEEGKGKRDEMISLVRERGVAALADAQIEGMLGKTTRQKSPELVRSVHAMLAAAPPEGVIGALAAMRDRADSTALLAHIKVPVLIVVGDEDVLTPPREARKMHEAIRGSALEIIAAAGHLSNVERPDEFNRIAAAFLASLPR